jgi:hypothetical protein
VSLRRLVVVGVAPLLGMLAAPVQLAACRNRSPLDPEKCGDCDLCLEAEAERVEALGHKPDSLMFLSDAIPATDEELARIRAGERPIVRDGRIVAWERDAKPSNKSKPYRLAGRGWGKGRRS